MKTYVVMPCYIVTEELERLTEEAIRSFKESSGAFVVAVDDGSPMKTSCMSKADKVLRNGENSGFAPTCNNGFKWVMEHEKDDCYIVCANNDILVHERVLPALREPFELFDNVAITGIVSFKTLEPEGKPIEEFEANRMSEGGQFGDWMQDGGLWMSKKSVLEKIGFFDEQFIRGGYEDVDLFLRARDTFGMRIVMSGRAGYWHKQGATRWNCENNGYINDFGRESKSIESENLEKFIKKWGYNPHINNPWRNIELWNA